MRRVAGDAERRVAQRNTAHARGTRTTHTTVYTLALSVVHSRAVSVSSSTPSSLARDVGLPCACRFFPGFFPLCLLRSGSFVSQRLAALCYVVPRSRWLLVCTPREVRCGTRCAACVGSGCLLPARGWSAVWLSSRRTHDWQLRPNGFTWRRQPPHVLSLATTSVENEISEPCGCHGHRLLHCVSFGFWSSLDTRRDSRKDS